MFSWAQICAFVLELTLAPNFTPTAGKKHSGFISSTQGRKWWIHALRTLSEV